jgi:hypothetical protein
MRTKEDILKALEDVHSKIASLKIDDSELKKYFEVAVSLNEIKSNIRYLDVIEPKQTEVSEKKYIPSDAFADELSVWKEKDYALQTSSMKEREAVEFVDWINNNEINGQYYRHQRLNIWNGDWNYDERHYSPLTTQQLYDLFKSKLSK